MLIPRSVPVRPRRRARSAAMLVAAVAGFGVAALGGLAVAKSFTLRVVSNATVTNTAGVSKHANIVVGANRPVYSLTGNSIKNCTKANTCFHFWPPVTVAAGKKPTAAPGVKGRLGTIRHDGVTQVTLNGHLLYNFLLDKSSRAATGEGIKSFGGTWHVIVASSSGRSSTTTSTGMTTTTTPGYSYPPGY